MHLLIVHVVHDHKWTFVAVEGKTAEVHKTTNRETESRTRNHVGSLQERGKEMRLNEYRRKKDTGYWEKKGLRTFVMCGGINTRTSSCTMFHADITPFALKQGIERERKREREKEREREREKERERERGRERVRKSLPPSLS